MNIVIYNVMPESITMGTAVYGNRNFTGNYFYI